MRARIFIRKEGHRLTDAMVKYETVYAAKNRHASLTTEDVLAAFDRGDEVSAYITALRST